MEDLKLNCGNPEEVPMFRVNQECLAKLVQVNNSDSLQPFGGLPGLMDALETNAETGIRGDAGADLSRRHKAFGSNLYLEEQSRPVVVDGFFQLALHGFKDTTIILLLCCAVLSAVIGIKRNGPVEGLRDGVIMVSAIFFVVYFGLICRFIKSRIRRRRLSKNKQHVCVIRHGKMPKNIPDSEVVVGDIVCLQAGNQVPADGLFIEGNSSFKLNHNFFHGDSNYYKNPSLFAGEKVMAGNCHMLVLSVGKNTETSGLMGSLSSSTQKKYNQESKLQISIDKTNSRLEKIWLSLSLFILVVQLFRCFLYVCDDSFNPDPKNVKNTLEDLMNESAKLMKKQGTKASGLVTVLSILLFALRDGLPLGIFVSFVYASNKMKSHGAIIKRLPSCATIGFVTTICTGVTNDLALHHSKMADLWIGFDCVKDVSTEVAREVLKILQDGVCAYASSNQGNALYYWAHQVIGIDMVGFNTSSSCTILDIESNKNSCGLVLKKHKEAGRILHIHWNGEFGKILSMCSHYYKGDGTIQTLDEDKKDLLHREFQQIASNCLEVLAFAYKQINQEEEKGEIDEDDADETEETLKSLEHGLIFLSLVSLKNPYAPETRQAIQDCRASGIDFKLVVDTDITTARIMALYSGILRPEEDIEGAITEASDFCKKGKEERLKAIENIHVIANTSPADRLQFVQCLKQKNKVVALTGSCIRDCPSLIGADVGIFMGNLHGSEYADIVALNKNVSTIFTLIKLGRCVYESVKKFVQLQLTLSITVFTVNFVFVIARKEVKLLPFQVLWINLIMDVLGALALAIRIVELRGESVVQDVGYPIITMTMWRNVAVQSLFQITILMILHFKGSNFFHEADETVMKSMINGCYAFSQVFGLITAMIMLKNRISLVEELFEYRRSLVILVIVGIIGVLEVGFVETMATIAHWGKLNSKEWCFCIGIAALSVPIFCAANWVAVATM